MKLTITATPSPADNKFIAQEVRKFNRQFTADDFQPLSIFQRNENDAIVAGLTGRTFWNYLYIDFLWVSENHRRSGFGSRVLITAEEEAARRGCRNASLDTFSFQALPFYLKHGYVEFGHVSGFCHDQHRRHYLHKTIHAAKSSDRQIN
ncbi:MAG: GNAT superfamily N-acetyltransferase [Verrucomicrobiales bacterium]|jgi:GNAT superfamily N-acetyltransferase